MCNIDEGRALTSLHLSICIGLQRSPKRIIELALVGWPFTMIASYGDI